MFSNSLKVIHKEHVDIRKDEEREELYYPRNRSTEVEGILH